MFRIGEFSRIAQVSGRLLRYYDELGLLSPNFTDPQTGYRYYSAHQLPQLNRILVLKEFGLSLEQVARLLDQRTSADELRSMLTLRKAQIEHTVHEEMARVRAIEARLQQLDADTHSQECNVVVKSVPAQEFLALREVLPGMEGIRQVVQNIVAVVPSVVGKNNPGTVAIVIHSPSYDSPSYDPDALDVEVGYLLTHKGPARVAVSGDRVLTARELPAVETMTTIVHVGPVIETHGSYGVLARWIEANGYQIAGPGREVIMQLPARGLQDEAVVELQFPVTKPTYPTRFSAAAGADE